MYLILEVQFSEEIKHVSNQNKNQYFLTILKIFCKACKMIELYLVSIECIVLLLYPP